MARATTTEKLLRELGFTHHTRAVGTLVHNLILVDRHGLAEMPNHINTRIPPEEIRARALKEGTALRTFVEETWAKTCDPSYRSLGVGTGPPLLVAWLFRAQFPEACSKFLHDVRNQRGSGDTPLGGFWTYLKSHHAREGSRGKTTLSSGEVLAAFLVAWDGYLLNYLRKG